MKLTTKQKVDLAQLGLAEVDQHKVDSIAKKAKQSRQSRLSYLTREIAKQI